MQCDVSQVVAPSSIDLERTHVYIAVVEVMGESKMHPEENIRGIQRTGV